MTTILRKLDQRRFLGIPIWEFSFNSLPRLYGRLFMWHIITRHPLRSWKGMLAYRRFFLHGRWEDGIAHLYNGTEADFREKILEAQNGLLVALGFCQKPIGMPDKGCPAGRFNHKCFVLARDDILEVPVGRLAAPCRDCDVRVVGMAALRAGATVYIMTSAVDIARHLFIPNLESARFRYGLFLQCSYSIPAMILPLLICGIRSLLIGYSEGDCRDYAQFLLADEGTKDERTFLSATAHDHVLDFLQSVASVRREGGQQVSRFRREGSLFVPAADA
jgi:hypothetical protein